MYKDTDLAWLAGFIDGEGYIGIIKYPKKHYYRLVLRIEQLDPAPLIWCEKVFGGKIYRDRKYSSWNLDNKRAANLFKELLPYLKLKREEAELGIALRETYNNYQFTGTKVPQEIVDIRDSYLQQAKDIKQRRRDVGS